MKFPGTDDQPCAGPDSLLIYRDPTFNETLNAEATYENLGCYPDSALALGAHILWYQQIEFDAEDLTPLLCQLECKRRNHPYAGAQAGNLCFCGVYLVVYGAEPVDEELCGVECLGNNLEFCGGKLNDYMSIYYASTLESSEPCGECDGSLPEPQPEPEPEPEPQPPRQCYCRVGGNVTRSVDTIGELWTGVLMREL